MSLHIKKDDMVEVITGDYKGTRGKVLSVDPVKGKAVVEGVNRCYKHVRPSRRNPQGGRLQIEQPIDLSNIMVVNQKTSKPTRVKFEINESGQKVRVALDGTEISTLGRSKKG